jgi:hypothetical protein
MRIRYAKQGPVDEFLREKEEGMVQREWTGESESGDED